MSKLQMYSRSRIFPLPGNYPSRKISCGWRNVPLILLVLLVSFAVNGCKEDNPPTPPTTEQQPPSTAMPAAMGEWGRFEGEVVSRWLEDERNMELIQDFAYIDPDNKKWFSGKGSVVDGASIPQAFWSTIGPPYVGYYRKASVVHDTACEYNKVHGEVSWQDVHLMFYQASRCGGVPDVKAKVMYWAVYSFGPRWELKNPPPAAAMSEISNVQPEPVQKQIVRLVNERIVAPERVYSMQKLDARNRLLTIKKEEGDKILRADERLKVLDRSIENENQLKMEKQRILENTAIERNRVADGLRNLDTTRLQPRELTARRLSSENRLRDLEASEAATVRTLNDLQDNVKRYEQEKSSLQNAIKESGIKIARTGGMISAEEELVDMSLVMNRVENYIKDNDPTLEEIQKLKLEDVLQYEAR